jgi:hypothetical protein
MVIGPLPEPPPARGGGGFRFGRMMCKSRRPPVMARPRLEQDGRGRRSSRSSTLFDRVIQISGDSAPVITLFCNGPLGVNPFRADPVAGISLLSGVGAQPPPDGV